MRAESLHTHRHTYPARTSLLFTTGQLASFPDIVCAFPSVTNEGVVYETVFRDGFSSKISFQFESLAQPTFSSNLRNRPDEENSRKMLFNSYKKKKEKNSDPARRIFDRRNLTISFPPTPIDVDRRAWRLDLNLSKEIQRSVDSVTLLVRLSLSLSL